jgi:hypothetical protein
LFLSYFSDFFFIPINLTLSWFALSNSKFALWALYVVQSLLTIRADAFRLVKAEVIHFLSLVDYGTWRRSVLDFVVLFRLCSFVSVV